LGLLVSLRGIEIVGWLVGYCSVSNGNVGEAGARICYGEIRFLDRGLHLWFVLDICVMPSAESEILSVVVSAC
jgi:hypothetical protein